MKILEYYLSQNKHKKHLIFDLDETLAWLKIDWSGFSHGIREFVQTFDAEMVARFGRERGSSQQLYNEIVRKHGYRVKKLIDEFCREWELSRLNGYEENRPLVEFVKQNLSNYQMYVWTNQNRATAIKALKEIGILDHFRQVVAKENENISKPDPDGFYLIFDADRHHRDEFLMIGDSDNDEVAALKAGIDFLRIKMGEE